jgi:DNA-nicking Smr family endonuclease
MKRIINTEDSELFRDAVGEVRPVSKNRVLHHRKQPRPVPRFREADETSVLRDMLSEQYEPADHENEGELYYVKPGLQQRTLKKLRRGQIHIAAELDLHGMVVPVARASVAEFLHECQRRHIQCARIIHGKGLGSRNRGPVLKIKLGNWLRQREEILAFCPARYNDGGTGAVYVLLKR